MRKLILGSIIAATFAVAMPAAAAVYIDVAPPPLRYEVVPAPRAGWVWAPGFWEWRHGRHLWVPGHWVRERVGFVYAPARWVAYGPRWVFVRGGWHRAARPW